MQSNKAKYGILRYRYPFFSYDHYDYQINQDVLIMRFYFNISDEFFFITKLNIPMRSFYYFQELYGLELDNLIFHIGMIELISYWKATCSPTVYIKPHLLSPEQRYWWKKLYFNGLGEFFYLNSINDVTFDNFMEIFSVGKNSLPIRRYTLDNSILIPIGGGKDSIVTLELLKNYSQHKIPMIINPRQATLDSAQTAGFTRTDIVEIHRTLDQQLLTLNAHGFLNGHTPLSAMLAFVTLVISVGTRTKHIALSNESSANEPTTKNSNVNHQYSKSLEFERDFRSYVNQYISPDFNYFSFLRPLSELTIAKLFAREPKYFSVFKSCNVGSKNDTWCRQCSKCLFTFIILSPFIAPKQLEEIFGENLLDKSTFKTEFDELIGLQDSKPFECVGTVVEIRAALKMTLVHYPAKLPYLLNYFHTSLASEISSISIPQDFLEEHFLTEEFEHILKCNISIESEGVRVEEVQN